MDNFQVDVRKYWEILVVITLENLAIALREFERIFVDVLNFNL